MRALRSILIGLGVVAGLVGLTINAAIMVPAEMSVTAAHPVARSLAETLVFYWTYFTHLTNLWLLLTYLAIVSGWRVLAPLARPFAMTSAAALIALVMVFFHFMLAPVSKMTGMLIWASYLLHYVTPLTYLAFWLLFMPHGRLRFGQLPAMLAPGLVYAAWALGRGAVVHEYPYAILDADKLGYGKVAISVGVIIAAVAVFAALLIVIDRLLGRRRGA